MKSRDITRTYGSWYFHYICAGGLQTLYVRHRKRTWAINRWCRRKARWSFDGSGRIKLAPVPDPDVLRVAMAAVDKAEAT